MTQHAVDGIEILLGAHPTGPTALAALWTLDFEYDRPPFVDLYGVLDGSAKAKVLKAALARRDDYRLLGPHSFEGYLVRMREPTIDEAAFRRIVARFTVAWRRRNGVE